LKERWEEQVRRLLLCADMKQYQGCIGLQHVGLEWVACRAWLHGWAS
jgi:hypothetical protein